MGQVLQFRRKNAFLPEETIAMAEAYDTAIAGLDHDTKSELFVRELGSEAFSSGSFYRRR